MDVREKLVEIIQNSVGGCARHWAEVIADGLIANGVTEQEWIPVTERLPEPYTRVLTYVQSYGRQAPHIVIDQIIVLPAGTHIWASGSASWKTETTHWTPLPEPPKEVE